jgi:hypothetical protein
MATKLGVGPIIPILYDTVYYMLYIKTTLKLIPNKARSPGTSFNNKDFSISVWISKDKCGTTKFPWSSDYFQCSL